MNYTKEQFDKCLFNPLEKDFFGSYPELKELWEDGEQPMRYIVAMYDPSSPLIKDFPDLNLRKQAAALLSGYELSESIIKQMFDFEWDPFRKAVDAFLKRVQNMKWAMIVSMEQTWWEWNARMLKPISSDKGDKDELQATEIKARIRDEMVKTLDLITLSYNQLYQGDEKLIEKIEVKQLRFNPQSIASVLKDKGR